MAGFLRRLRRPKDEEKPEAAEGPPSLEPESEGHEAASPPGAPVLERPSAEPTAQPATPPPTASSPVEVPAPNPAPTPSIPPVLPPPLPEADKEAARSSVPRRGPTTKCFICGSELDAGSCPKCRMTWTE